MENVKTASIHELRPMANPALLIHVLIPKPKSFVKMVHVNNVHLAIELLRMENPAKKMCAGTKSRNFHLEIAIDNEYRRIWERKYLEFVVLCRA